MCGCFEAISFLLEADNPKRYNDKDIDINYLIAWCLPVVLPIDPVVLLFPFGSLIHDDFSVWE